MHDSLSPYEPYGSVTWLAKLDLVSVGLWHIWSQRFCAGHDFKARVKIHHRGGEFGKDPDIAFSGHTGFRGVNPYVNVGFGQILNNVNVISSLAGEVRKGRFGVLGDYLYLNGQAGTDERAGLVSKVDLGLQQFIGEFFGSYRIIEGPRGWLDLLGGLRNIYLGSQVGLQANNVAINAASTQLVDQFAQQLTTPGSDLRTLIQQNIVDRLTAL